MAGTTQQDPTLLFEEIQHTSRNVALFTIGITFVVLAAASMAAVRHGELASAAPGLLLGGAIAAGAAILVTASRLITRVSTERAHISYWPFKTIELRPADIATVTMRNFGLFDGGIGYHVGFKSMALTAATGSGVQITRPDGRRILVGTRRPDALMSALMRLAQGAPR